MIPLESKSERTPNKHYQTFSLDISIQREPITQPSTQNHSITNNEHQLIKQTQDNHINTLPQQIKTNNNIKQ